MTRTDPAPAPGPAEVVRLDRFLGDLLDLASPEAEGFTDGFRVRRLTDCLLANALRLTPEGSPVVLALRAGDGQAEVEVRDGGPGLTKNDVTVAFERGALHERYRDLRPVGTGLGLAIAHRLATRLGGTLTAGARGPENGAVFMTSCSTEGDCDQAGGLRRQWFVTCTAVRVPRLRYWCHGGCVCSRSCSSAPWRAVSRVFPCSWSSGLVGVGARGPCWLP
ncbi:sensor histidine kinase [Streptomyces sp. NPDC102462]|uniref:sensor histidine kinase n=1 Tax=Streptomyces sp. NPDC102462 TaxID=3366178 RepID=UPI0038022086